MDLESSQLYSTEPIKRFRAGATLKLPFLTLSKLFFKKYFKNTSVAQNKFRLFSRAK